MCQSYLCITRKHPHRWLHKQKNLSFFFLYVFIINFFLTSHVKCLTLFCITQFICKKIKGILQFTKTIGNPLQRVVGTWLQ